MEFVSTVAVAVVPAVAPAAIPADLVQVPVQSPADSWERQVQAANIAQGFLPIRPARPFMDFERPDFEGKPYPERVTASLEDRLEALPKERCNIKEAVAAFTEREGRKPESPEEVIQIAREAGIRELSYFGLYRDFQHEGYLAVIKNGRPTL